MHCIPPHSGFFFCRNMSQRVLFLTCNKKYKSEKTVYLSFLLCQCIASQQEAIAISKVILTLHELPITSSMMQVLHKNNSKLLGMRHRTSLLLEKCYEPVSNNQSLMAGVASAPLICVII